MEFENTECANCHAIGRKLIDRACMDCWDTMNESEMIAILGREKFERGVWEGLMVIKSAIAQHEDKLRELTEREARIVEERMAEIKNMNDPWWRLGS